MSLPEHSLVKSRADPKSLADQVVEERFHRADLSEFFGQQDEPDDPGNVEDRIVE